MTATHQAVAPNRRHGHAATEMPSGLIVGTGPGGPVTMRLFRGEPTRLFLSVSDYVTWLIAFRAVCLGAHLSVIAENHRPWLTLAETVRMCGGTIDLLHGTTNIPGQGRPYRPSLIIDAAGKITPTDQLGAWQSLATIGDPEGSRAVGDLRSCEMALMTSVSERAAEHLRRAYALTTAQANLASEAAESEVILASVRRITKVALGPSPTEYRLLFGR